MGKLEQKMSNIDNSAFSLYYVAPQSSESGLLPLFFSMVGDEQCAPTYRVYRENADISVLIYVLSGSGKLELKEPPALSPRAMFCYCHKALPTATKPPNKTPGGFCGLI